MRQLCKGKASPPWHALRFPVQTGGSEHCNCALVVYYATTFAHEKTWPGCVHRFPRFFANLPTRGAIGGPQRDIFKSLHDFAAGEKLEHDNQFKAALAKYRFAGSLLEELRKRHADWQPAIVEYRSRKVSENILRVQDKAATQADLNAGPTPLPGGAPVLPEQSGPEPSVEVVA